MAQLTPEQQRALNGIVKRMRATLHEIEVLDERKAKLVARLKYESKPLASYVEGASA